MAKREFGLRHGVWLVVLILLCARGEKCSASADLTARELLRRMQQSYNQVESYQCLLSVFSRKGDRTEELKLRFAFKKPGMLRARVVSGDHRGREVAIRKDGRIRGREGGLLRPIKLALDRDDRRLCNIRGVPVWEAEWGAFLRKIQRLLDEPSASAVVSPGESGMLMLDIRHTGEKGLERHLYSVDPASFGLHSGEVYEADVLVSRVVCDGETLNPDLPDGYFNL